MQIGMSLGMRKPSGLTTIQRAIAVLRKFGTDAHVWLPGVGSLNGLTASNYLLSDASTGLAPVDQYVGLASDALGGLGVELVTDPGFDDSSKWLLTQPTSGSVAVSGGVLVLNSADGSYASCGVIAESARAVVNKTYQYRVETTANSGTGVIVTVGNVASAAITGVGTFSGIVVAATASLPFIKRASGTSNTTVTSFSVREVTGIAVTQGTTANKPKLVRGAVNLLTYSGDFTNAAWMQTKLTAALNAADPYGTANSATVLTEDGTSGSHEMLLVTPVTVVSGSANTVAVVVKANGRNYARVMFVDGTLAHRVYVDIDFAAGTISAATLVGSATSTASPSITPIGNGYYLVAISGVMSTATSVNLYLRACDTLGNVVYTGSGFPALNVHRIGLFQGTYTAAKIQALGGIPLTTTAPASTALGSFAWQFDGSNDSLALSSVPFQMSDDVCNIVVAKCPVAPGAGKASYIFGTKGDNWLSNAGISFGYSGKPTASWYDGTTAVEIAHSTAVTDKVVISSRKLGNEKSLTVNGVQSGATNTTVLADGTLLNSYIGSSSGTVASALVPSTYAMNGEIYGILSIKGSVTDSQRLLLTKLMRSIAGITL